MSINSLVKSNERWNSYLFDYGYDGESWSFEIPARTEQEAKERVEQLTNAKYLGEIKLTVPGQYGLLVRLLCRVRNLFYLQRY
jgi:hypothetical protein